MRTKIAVSVISMAALGVHLARPNLKLDSIALGLIVLGVLPWLSSLIKSAEVPGVGKIEFQDVKKAAEQVVANAPTPPVPSHPSEPAFLSIVDQDPALALVGLRIEIEKRLRALADAKNIPRGLPLSRLTQELQKYEIIDGASAAGLRDLIAYGNQAAHGTEVAHEVALSAVDFAPRVLEVLDQRLAQLKAGAG